MCVYYREQRREEKTRREEKRGVISVTGTVLGAGDEQMEY